MAGFPSPWIIGWGVRFQAGLRDEDASAATSSEIDEAPRSEPGDAAHAALHAAGRDDEFTLIGGPPSSRQAGRRHPSPYPRLALQTPRHCHQVAYHGQCLIRVEMAVMAATAALMILVSASVHQSQREVST